jgi:hypothetical protein
MIASLYFQLSCLTSHNRANNYVDPYRYDFNKTSYFILVEMLIKQEL